jgi:hypothetical protein
METFLNIVLPLVLFLVGYVLGIRKRGQKKVRKVVSQASNSDGHVPLQYLARSHEEIKKRAEKNFELMNFRRSCRFFKSDPIPREALDNVIRAAGTSPSGAHTEPWTYVVIEDQEVKRKLRDIIEAEEKVGFFSFPFLFVYFLERLGKLCVANGNQLGDGY